MEKILLVDDEPLILKALVRLLQRTPCLCDGRLFKLELVTFSDPSKALEYVRNHQVSLVLSDYRMPGMDQGASTLCSLINQRTIEHDNRHSNLLSSVYFVGLAHRIHSA